MDKIIKTKSNVIESFRMGLNWEPSPWGANVVTAILRNQLITECDNQEDSDRKKQLWLSSLFSSFSPRSEFFQLLVCVESKVSNWDHQRAALVPVSTSCDSTSSLLKLSSSISNEYTDVLSDSELFSESNSSEDILFRKFTNVLALKFIEKNARSKPLLLPDETTMSWMEVIK